MASVTFSFGETPRSVRVRQLQAIRRRRRITAFGTVVAAIIVVLGTAEGSLRLLEAWYERPVERVFRTAAATLPPGSFVRGRTVNTLGYWDDEFDAVPHAGKFRIALVGGRTTFGGDATTGLAAQLERLLSGIEIDHFGLVDGSPAAYAAQLPRDVLRFHPQLVLFCLSPVDDAATVDAPHETREVRLWQLSQSLTRSAASPDPLRSLIERVDYDAFVRRRSIVLAECRTDDDEPTDRRRRAAQRAFERAVERCRRQGVGVAAIFAPSEFQLNPSLADALRRRAGIAAEQFDVELPQRRWSALTDHLQLPVLDLLPTFRSADAVLYEPATTDWNAAGCALAAETTARWLQPRLVASVAASPSHE